MTRSPRLHPLPRVAATVLLLAACVSLTRAAHAAKPLLAFKVDDTVTARRFYGETLGLPVHDEPMGLLGIELGARRVMVYPKEDHAPAGYTVLNFPVTDVRTAVRALGERGVEFLRYDDFEQDELGITRGQGPEIAWFADPAGNVLSVLSRP